MDDQNSYWKHDEIKEVLKRPPIWIVRWGITTLFVSVALLLLFTWLYKYPDKIEARVVVSAKNPPVSLVARVDGKIVDLKAENRQVVSQGQLIITLESAADAEKIGELEQFLRIIEADVYFDINEPIPVYDGLGEVQWAYANLIKANNDFRFFSRHNNSGSILKSLDGQLQSLKEYEKSLYVQLSLFDKNVLINSEKHLRDSLLLSDGVISNEEYKETRSEWIETELQREKCKSEIIQTQSDIHRLMNQKNTYQEEYDLSLDSHRQAYLKAYQELKGVLMEWKLDHQLISPVDGVINYVHFWAKNQFVAKGKTIAVVVPNELNQVLCKAFIPIKGSGKVKIGQNVNIRLDNYPHAEYGLLCGVVHNKANVPVDGVYLTEIYLEKGLQTNYDYQLEMTRELQGTAEVITNEMRLLQRIFDPMKALLKENVWNQGE